MNNKKRFVLIALAVVMTAILGLSLVACDGSLRDQIRDLQNKVNGFEADFAEKSIVVYVGEKEFAITTRKSFLHDVLKDMNTKSQISQYQYSGGDVSPYITQIDVLQQDFINYKYYSLWHSVDEFAFKAVYSEKGGMPGRGVKKTEGEGDWATTFVATTYQEKTLYYSNVGVGLLPIVNGAVYAVLVD